MTYQERLWAILQRWSDRVDGSRDLSDEASRWASEEANRFPLPKNQGEMMGSLEVAFDAGRQWERILAGKVPLPTEDTK